VIGAALIVPVISGAFANLTGWRRGWRSGSPCTVSASAPSGDCGHDLDGPAYVDHLIGFVTAAVIASGSGRRATSREGHPGSGQAG